MASIYKRDRGFELRTTQEQIQQVARAGLEPGTAGLRVRRVDHSATLLLLFRVNLQLLFQLERLGFQLNVNLMRN